MKNLIYLVSVVFLTVSSFSACSESTYAEELKQEKILIEEFAKLHKINVIKVLPLDSTIWNENDYYVTADGLYFHLVHPGTGTDTLEINDIVVPRFRQYTLNVVADTINNWTTVDFPYPTDFSYFDFTQSCSAFHLAASFMKRNESEAKIIVPSKLGFTEYWTPATPMGYDLKIKIKK
jgi:hypothetical protein